MKSIVKNKKLEEGRQRFLQLRKEGKVTVEYLNPIEKANKHPTSLKKAVAAMCYDCMGRETSYRADIRTCAALECPLFGHRPYK